MRGRLFLVAILAVAAALRLLGLGWGLRHPPHIDEQLFVEATSGMLAAGDLNHRFYEYPALFIYVLAPALAPFQPPGPETYLAARVVVAGFGVLSVGLVYLLARAMLGEPGGRFAAALLAVAPAEVRTAHMLRPDVALESFALLAFLAFRAVGAKAKGDALAGAAIGAATAVKFSGVLLLPAYLARRLAAPGFRLARLLLAGASALAAFALLSPYTLLDLPDALHGMGTQLAWHYRERTRSLEYLDALAAYARLLLDALGAPALLLAAVGLWLKRAAWRDWLPFLALPLVTLAVFSTAQVQLERFLVPVLGIVAALAAATFSASMRRPLVAALLAAASLVPPARASIQYVRAIRLPCTRDVAADWIRDRVPAGARMLVARSAEIALDPARYEAIRVDRIDPRLRYLALHMDVVAAARLDVGRLDPGMRELFVAEPATAYSGDAIRLLTAPDALRPQYRDVPLAEALLTASDAAEQLGAIHDGDRGSAWRPAAGATAWIEVDFGRTLALGRLELFSGDAAPGLGIALEAAPKPGARLQPVRFLSARAPLEQQWGERSQVLILVHVRARTLRIALNQRSAKPWSVAELRIEALAE